MAVGLNSDGDQNLEPNLSVDEPEDIKKTALQTCCVKANI